MRSKAAAATALRQGSAERKRADDEVQAINAVTSAITKEETKETVNVKPGAALAAAKQLLGESTGRLLRTDIAIR